MPQKDIFISHAVKDKPLADAFVDLLETGIGISSNDIFCSSLEGMGIPAGKNFLDYIREQIQEPKAVILLLTPNYYGSNFCLCELGATWAMSHEFCPILVPPLNYEDIKDVLTASQLIKIDNKTNLSEFRDRLINIVNVSGKPTAKWEAKRNAFLKILPQILSTLPTPQAVSFSEHEKLQKNYKESLTEMENYEAEITTLKQRISDLEKCKDSDQVQAVQEKYSTEIEYFRQLIEKICDIIKVFPRIVIEALYRHYTDRPYLIYINAFDDKYEIEAANLAKDNGYLMQGDSQEAMYSIDLADPSIYKAVEALDKLNSFIEEKMGSDCSVILGKEANCQISLNNKIFWGHYLRDF